ncbi:unnamed protein product [Urochloa decumbens]|uniref:Protein kinase domain-containing protein n=1 Tax=Urochloa decumbens TaxID=240449 RepID=A0ABC8W2F3_9POAL
MSVLTTASMARQLVLAAAVAALVSLSQLLLLASAAADQIGLPGCPTICGNISVPYPFGITPECSLPGFNLTCDDTSRGTPLRLSFGGNGTLRVTNISLDDATVRVYGPAIEIKLSSDIDAGGGSWGGQAWGLNDGSSAACVLSPAHNELVVTGCGIFAELRTTDYDEVVIGSCGSVCSPGQPYILQTSSRGCKKCSGIGCCQTAITKADTFYNVRLTAISSGGFEGAPGEGPAGTLFIAEEGWFDSRSNHTGAAINLTAAKFDEDMMTNVPAVLAWMIPHSMLQEPAAGEPRDGNATTCTRDTGATVCHSRYSSCTNTTIQTSSSSSEPTYVAKIGYICKCWDGYKGNPYLIDGCQDIDECALPDKCYWSCKNLPGNYSCQCPEGTSGDPYRPNGCTKLHGSRAGLIIALGIGIGTGLLILVLGSAFLVHKVKAVKKKRQRQRFFKQNRGQLLQQLLCQKTDIAERMIITLEELEKATNNFDKARDLGGGGHGTVYKGILSSLHVVAIKRSNIVIQREIDEFINEVAILSQVNHRNIVKLHGCCLETQVPLLVYEFISSGTLYNHLHVEAPISLSWRDRLRIAVEIARALTYLHSFVSMPIIHRDIKSPNILLDDNFIVKLADFGASRYIPVDQSGVDTVVQGTLGYLDPMYHSTGHLTEKSDVYSFGVLLIELLTRKKPVSYRSARGYSLTKHFVTLISEGKLFDILDPQVSKEGDGEVIDVALLAAICVKLNGEDRPTMRKVEMALESIHASKEYASMSATDDESENWIQVNDATVGETRIEDACWDE